MSQRIGSSWLEVDKGLPGSSSPPRGPPAATSGGTRLRTTCRRHHSSGVTGTEPSRRLSAPEERCLLGETMNLGEWVPRCVFVYLKLGSGRGPACNVLAEQVRQQRRSHVHACRDARRCPPVTVLDPPCLSDPVDFVTLPTHPLKGGLV